MSVAWALLLFPLQVDMDVLSEQYASEQEDYFIGTSQVGAWKERE